MHSSILVAGHDLKLIRQLYDNQRSGGFMKRGTELRCFLPLPLVVIFLFVLSVVYSTLPISDLSHQIDGAWFRSIDYTGIMTIVSPNNDPELFYADQALENIIYVSPELEPYQYDNEIAWDVGGKSNAWYLYFQSLKVVGYLANGAEVSGDTRYLEKAAEIIESWFDFHHNNKTPPPYAWGDHATAERVRNVTHFLRAYSSSKDIHLPDSFFEKVRTILRQHATWLLDEENYDPYNHGMMTSIALTQIAFTFPELDHGGLWKETSISRIKERIENDLSIEGVHLEHSPYYQLVFINLVLKVEEYLDAKNVCLFQADDDTIEKMKQYIAYMIKPNQRLPMIGDTSDRMLTQHYNHPWITYSLSGGNDGASPPDNSMVYPDANVAIFRDEWKAGDNFTKTSYLMFQSGFHSKYHKHADDLGFILYSGGEDIFVGPGVYAYGSSEYRQYVTSAQAHNTLTVDGKTYAISRDNVGKADVTAYSLEEAFDFVQGSHTMYEGVELKRGIVFIRPATILVIDEAVSGTEHSIQQIWNLSPVAHDLKFDSDGASFLVGENGAYAEIRQLSPTTGVNHYYGQEEPVRGFISPQQRELVPVHQLEFEGYGNGIVFVTQITVASSSEDVPTIDVDLNKPYRDIVVHHGDDTTLTINLEPALQSQVR